MRIETIETNDELTAALKCVDKLWGAEEGTPNSTELDRLVKLIAAYENEIGIWWLKRDTERDAR